MNATSIQLADCAICGNRRYLSVLTPTGAYRSMPCTCILDYRRRLRIAEMHEASHIPPLFANAHCGGLDIRDEETRRANAKIEELAAKPLRGDTTIFLEGPTGIGKTYLACALANAQIDRFLIPVTYVSVPALMLRLLPGGAEPEEQTLMREEAKAAPILVFDELGVEKRSAWVMRQLFDILDERMKQLRPTIVTTNLELREIFGDQAADVDPDAVAVARRIYSRLSSSGIGITWKAQDYRKIAGRIMRRSEDQVRGEMAQHIAATRQQGINLVEGLEGPEVRKR